MSASSGTRTRATARRTATAVIGASFLLACGNAEPPRDARANPSSATTGVASCLAPGTLSGRLEFASSDQAAEILGRSDAWARQLSAFDRSARMRTPEAVDTDEFLAFLSDNVLAWTSDEQALWSRLVDRLSTAVAGLRLDIPRVVMVKTTGMEEFGFVYVRNQAIVLPRGRVEIAGDERSDFFLLAHEFFHYLSTENPAIRDRLYALLGFRRADGFMYPPELDERRTSNPVWYADYTALQVETPDGPVDVVPLIRPRIPVQDVIRLPSGGRPAIFEHIEVVLVAVDTATDEVLRDEGGELVTYSADDTDWTHRMQRNTSYILHPQEVLADNFALLMEWRGTRAMPEETPSGFRVNDVELLSAMRDVLSADCVSEHTGPMP